MRKKRYHIKPYLKKKGYNLSGLARNLGMSFQRFDHHIKETTNLSVNVARDIAKELNLPLEKFIQEVEITTSDIADEMENQPFGD